ncbi:hypothetical protein ACQP2U_04485 [Nocardia sp. CA-084685]|uniref:hypothetical protein n=1 Tax=Nocardia sp. CA-084685 TaxID=3239970 RepID=UPI003D9790D9
MAADHAPRAVEVRTVILGRSKSRIIRTSAELDLPAAWQFSRGAGQKVAVIDTGVNRHPRPPALQTRSSSGAGRPPWSWPHPYLPPL